MSPVPANAFASDESGSVTMNGDEHMINGNEINTNENITNENNMNGDDDYLKYDFNPLNDKTRHGFEDAYEDYKEHLKHFYLYFYGKKYADNFRPILEAEKKLKGKYFEFATDWKNGRNKVLTTQGGIFICLNTLVDPPDGKKGKPCSKSEGWIDPYSFTAHNQAAAAVADNVMKQYKALTMKATFKAFPDTVVDDMKKALITWRRSNKENNTNNRYLFHYNGHGVPDPTPSGEFWVFNRQYTQYIPVAINDLQNWLGAPCVLVYDCNKAGNLVNGFKHCTQVKIDNYNELQRKYKSQEQQQQPGPGQYDANARNKNNPYLSMNPTQFLECYQFAACSSDEYLPSAPDLPADLFTCCMTTPIEISIKFFILRNPLTALYYKDLFEKDLTTVGPDFKQKKHKLNDFDVSYFKRIPEKKDQIADLTYIYTSVTDTIAYTLVPRNLFRRCFRQDAACSALFRNFLLAQRIMKYYNCNPISDPVLPDCHENELWKHWDLAIEHFLTSLVQLKELDPHHSLSHALSESPRYIFSNFFDTSLDHLKNWIEYGHFTMVPPPQLTMILQLLLTPKYRARALKMLAFFVDLGPWAVSLALNIGVFPYVVKLLQSPVIQLKPMLTFVWAKLLACDYKSMQYDSYASNGGCFKYFYFMLLPEKEVLSDLQVRHKNAYFESIDKQAKEQKRLEAKIGKPALSIFQSDENVPFKDFEAEPHKFIDYDNSRGLTYHHFTVALVVLTLFIKNYSNARDKLLDLDLYMRVILLIERGKPKHSNLQLWGALFLSQAWNNSPQAKYLCYKAGILPRLIRMFHDEDSIADLRAAIIYSFTTYLTVHDTSSNKLTEELEKLEVSLAETVISNIYDSSVAVRKEIVVFLSTFIHKYLPFFILAAFSSLQEEIVIIEAHEELFEFRRKTQIYGTIYSASWKALLIFSSDPHDEVQNMAEQVIVYVLNALKEHPDLKEPYEYCYSYLVQKLISTGDREYDDHETSLARTSPVRNKKSRRVVSAYGSPNKRHSSGDSDRDSVNSVKSSQSFSGVDGILHKTVSISNFIKYMAGYSNGEQKTSTPQKTRRTSSFSGQRFKSAANYKLFDGESYGSLPHPLPPRFQQMSLKTTSPVIPLKSILLEFCTEYFQFPQLSGWPENHPLIDEYDMKFGKWRKLRNDAYIDKTQGEKELSLQGDWSVPLSTINTGSATKVFEFTQFDNYLVTSDSRDVVSVWDYQKSENLCLFSNNNPVGSKISQLQFMNEDDTPILLVGCNDGTVKLYKDFDCLDRCRLISAWQTLSNVIGINDGTNFVFEWQQARGDLVATGNIKTINIWNAFKERCYVNIPKRSSFPITSLTCDQLDGSIFAAGFSNGDIRVYDKRCKPREEMIKEWIGRSRNPTLPSRTSINNIHMQRGGFRELVSASNSGLVQIWDIRANSPIDTFETGGPLKGMRVHEHAPIFVTGSDSVKVWTTAGYTVCDFYNDQRNMNLSHKSYFGSSYLSSTHKSGNILNLSLHPHKMVLAASSANDPTINIYNAVESSL